MGWFCASHFSQVSASPPGGSSATSISFAPVRVAEETSSAATFAGCGTIEIELAGARMRISGAVDSATLTAALAALAGGRRR